MIRFKQAIVRRPGENLANGITTARLGTPDFALAQRQHAAYCAALQAAGLDLIVLPADERYPDGCFVEDTAVVAEEVAVIARPGDPTRRGEEKRIAEVLAEYKAIETIVSPGQLEGGDVLRVGDHFYIGRSRRTNAAGAEQLSRILSRYGYTASTIPVREVLHLKTGVTYAGGDTFIATAEFLEPFADFDTIRVTPAEAYAANCLWVNGHLLLPAGFPYVAESLRERGRTLLLVEMSEFRKLDGGLTCLSILF